MRSLRVSALVAAIAAFILRSVLVVPFLTDGRLRFDALDEGAIPAKGEVFFSLLMFGLVVGAAGAYQWVQKRHASDDLWKVAITVAIALGGVFFILDLVINLTASGRTLTEFLTNQVLDYTPLIVIPLAMGITARRAGTLQTSGR